LLWTNFTAAPVFALQQALRVFRAPQFGFNYRDMRLTEVYGEPVRQIVS
jgi:hypothetical protein